MRLKEICNLRTDQVISHVAILPETKTTPRKVPLSSRAIELLEKLVPIDGYYFGGNSERYSALFRKIRQRTPIKDLTFHDTRHEAITRLAKKLDVLDLGRMVGHKDLLIAKKYLERFLLKLVICIILLYGQQNKQSVNTHQIQEYKSLNLDGPQRSSTQLIKRKNILQPTKI